MKNSAVSGSGGVARVPVTLMRPESICALREAVCGGSGVRVRVVGPGLRATKMTAGLKPGPLATTPEAVADPYVNALAGCAHTVWVAARLRWLFASLRQMPQAPLRRLAL